MDALVNGKEAASGPAAITVEKQKHNFRTQYGTFSDKPSENITRWLEKTVPTSEEKINVVLEIINEKISKQI